MPRKSNKWLQVILVSLILAVAVITVPNQLRATWVDPFEAPPAGTYTEVPVMTDASSQIKSGNLTIGGNLTVNSTVCLNLDCKSTLIGAIAEGADFLELKPLGENADYIRIIGTFTGWHWNDTFNIISGIDLDIENYTIPQSFNPKELMLNFRQSMAATAEIDLIFTMGDGTKRTVTDIKFSDGSYSVNGYDGGSGDQAANLTVNTVAISKDNSDQTFLGIWLDNTRYADIVITNVKVSWEPIGGFIHSIIFGSMPPYDANSVARPTIYGESPLSVIFYPNDSYAVFGKADSTGDPGINFNMYGVMGKVNEDSSVGIFGYNYAYAGGAGGFAGYHQGRVRIEGATGDLELMKNEQDLYYLFGASNLDLTGDLLLLKVPGADPNDGSQTDGGDICLYANVTGQECINEWTDIAVLHGPLPPSRWVINSGDIYKTYISNVAATVAVGGKNQSKEINKTEFVFNPSQQKMVTGIADPNVPDDQINYWALTCGDGACNSREVCGTIDSNLDSTCPTDCGFCTDITPPPDVSFFQVALAGHQQLYLTWNEPSATPDFKGTLILRRLGGYAGVGQKPTDGTTYSVNDMIDDARVVFIGEGGEENFLDNSGLVNSTPYYYSAYAYDDSNNYAEDNSVSTHAAGIPLSIPECADGIDNDGNGCADYPEDSGCSVAIDWDESGGACGDTTPPPDVTNFNVLAGNSWIQLSWNDPVSTPDYAATLVLRRIGGYPSTNPTNGSVYPVGSIIGDAEVVYNTNSTGTVKWNDMPKVNKTDYYYEAYTWDNSLNYSADNSAGSRDWGTPSKEGGSQPPIVEI
ncbi:MAG: hypothetical protein V1838_01085 [Patescibacteria group bacterium]